MLSKIIDFVTLKLISPINFNRIKFLFTGRYYDLTEVDRDRCKDLMESGHYIWLSRRKTHLTTYLISLGSFGLELIRWSKKEQEFPKFNFAKYTHAFFNITDDLLVEAVGEGVKESFFDSVFDCDWICALEIKNLLPHEWEKIAQDMVKDSFNKLGTKYDTLFDIKDESRLSCIELIRVLMKESISPVEYTNKMSNFESLISLNNNLTPQMIRDSSSFEILLEIKR